jgi:type IV pilus assembly protein PilX
MNACTGYPAYGRRQRGVALIIALVLLVIATLIGLSASRGTLLQEKMSSNTYDRSLSFQGAEAALRAAEVAISNNWEIATLNGVDCSPASLLQCRIVPADTFTGTSANWIDVTGIYNVNSTHSAGTPQYQIHLIGTGTAENSLGAQANANSGNYGNNAAPDSVAFYRVTARSSDPTTTTGRAVVVLQTVVRRAF